MSVRRRWPIRRRLVLAVTAMVLLVALLGGVVFNLAAYFVEDDLLAAHVELELQALAEEWADGTRPLVAGSRLMKAAINGEGLPPEVAVQAKVLGPGVHELLDLELGDGTEPRDVMLGIRSLPDGSQLVVWYQTWLLEEGDASQRWRLALGIGLPLGLAMVAWLVIGALSNLIFRPLETLAAAVAQRQDGEELFAPLREQFAADEIGAIAGVFDEHLSRIRAFTERERRFTRDASHELRTPLAVIAAALDCLPDEATAPAQRRSLGRIRRACIRMQSLIETFLLLARDENGQQHATTPEEIIARLDLPAEIDVEIAVSGVSVPWADLVVVMLDNLVRNAQVHGGGDLVVQWGVDGVRVTNAIDPARPIPPDALAAGSRGPGSDGFGLGLDIVRHLAERVGWHVMVAIEDGRFVVHLASRGGVEGSVDC